MSNKSIYYRKFNDIDPIPAMNRHIVTKSYYKMMCGGCNSIINRGDLITHCQDYMGMKLRGRGNDNGFYTPYTGSRWVHRDCNITEWDDFYQMDITVWTDWAAMKFADDIESSIEEESSIELELV